MQNNSSTRKQGKNQPTGKKGKKRKIPFKPNGYTAPMKDEKPDNDPMMDDEFIPITFDRESAIPIEQPLMNSYGLDLTNPDYIGFTYGIILIDVIGGVHDMVLSQLKVTLKFRKKGNNSAMDVYRTQQVDLFNDGQVGYTIRSASERIKVESHVLKQAVYELTDRLERYRTDRLQGTGNIGPQKQQSRESIRSVKKYLKQKSLLDALKTSLKSAGMADEEFALKLFILGLSRITVQPIHVVVQGRVLLAHELMTSFSTIIPEDHLREATSISKNALSYPPYPEYWHHKTLIVHQMDSALKEGSALLEYVNQGGLKRIVTELDKQNRIYRSGEKNNTETFGIIGYTNREFHPVFNASNVVCLPLTGTDKLKQQLYDKEIRRFAGMMDADAQQEQIQLLKDIQQYIKPIKVINPYLDQVDFQKFFGSELKHIRLFLQITNLIAMLHQEQLSLKKERGVEYIEVEPGHMLMSLELYKALWLEKEAELYFRVRSTFHTIKKLVKEQYEKEYKDARFKIRDLRPKGISYSTFCRHAKVLENYGKIRRVGGDNRNGYEYKVMEWEDSGNKAEAFQELLDVIKKLS